MLNQFGLKWSDSVILLMVKNTSFKSSQNLDFFWLYQTMMLMVINN